MKSLNKRDLSKSQTWIEINKEALLNNISQIKKQLKSSVKFMAVVKANAYGHGLLEVVEAIQNKVDYLAVFSFEDAVLLREQGVKKPLLVQSRIFPKQINLAIKHDIEVTVSTLDILQKVKKNLKIHICVDTGLGRDGFVSSDLKKIASLLKKTSAKLCGIYGHFAAADDSKFDDYSKKQIQELLRWKKELACPLFHHAASAGTVYGKNHPDFEMVRIGIALYGLWPSPERNKSIKLEPVLSWRARITEIKSLPKGSVISYGCTHILERDSKVALVPIGYYDGISRLSSGKSQVILCGKKVPQIGRVTMNLIVIDVTDVERAKVGDVATIIGQDGDAEVTANDWANWSQTSNYEVVTRLNSALKRIVF
ncbi:MAG: alanine racemase [Proteobacteria bacterium]|nr:alanine racemase [Pseudomonadota bacterium]